jgi:hypothetical protein
MRHYIIISILALMELFTACQKDSVNVAMVSVNAAGEYFVNGEAELIISLSEAVGNAVNYDIKVSGTIPQENMEFNGKDVIPAGTSVVAVPVKVNTEGMEEGEYEAVFTMYSVIGASMDPEMKSVTILLNVISAEQ